MKFIVYDWSDTSPNHIILLRHTTVLLSSLTPPPLPRANPLPSRSDTMMASSHLLSHHPHPFSFDGKRSSGLFKKGAASPTPCFGLGTSCWRRTTRSRPSHRIMADSTSGRRQVEVRRITKLNALIVVLLFQLVYSRAFSQGNLVSR